MAGRLEFNFSLRTLSDVWELETENAVVLNDTSALVHFYAADVENLRSARVRLAPPEPSSTQPTLSYVIDSNAMENLPLAGRDLYASLVMQPGVTADNATARGLGVSINGQRPSSSDFLLDGVENNNYLITGPPSAIAPEGMQEYRVSTNNFSAEYGGTGGFLANAVTRSGGNTHHGLVYGYLGNDTFDANDFQRNRLGLERTPRTEIHAGFRVGGPILRRKLFYSGALQRFTSRSRLGKTLEQLTGLADSQGGPLEAQDELIDGLLPLPAQQLRGCLEATLGVEVPENSAGLSLLGAFAPPFVGAPAAGHCLTPYSYFAPVSVNRTLGLARFDFQPRDKDRFMARLAFVRGCVKKTRERHAVREMKVGPSEPACRSRLQTAVSCFSQKLRW